jgi:flagellar biosynthetic protein FlhB
MAMADRTIPASPRRREQAREQGLAPTAAVLVWPTLAVLVLAALPAWTRATVAAAITAIKSATAAGQGGAGVSVWLSLVLPTVVLVSVATTVLVGMRLLLDGAAWRISRAAFHGGRISPGAGFRRIFSWLTVGRGLFSAVSLGVLLGTVWWAADPLAAAIGGSLPITAAGFSLEEAGRMVAVAERFLWVFLAVAAVVAAIQWGTQRLRFERQIRMTPEELREEMRSLQADPKVRFQKHGR